MVGTDFDRGALHGIEGAGALVKLGLKEHGALVSVDFPDGKAIPVYKFADGWEAFIIRGQRDDVNEAFGLKGHQTFLVARWPHDGIWKFLPVTAAAAGQTNWS